MKIYVFEYITGGGMLDGCLSPSLVREGDLMLRALAADLCALAGVECLITRDARLDGIGLPLDCRCVGTPDQFCRIWDEALASVDAVWPIVPESQGALERISETILAAGKTLLNSTPLAVRTATSKLQTLRLLEFHGVPVVPTFGHQDVLPALKGRWVLKPDDGVGCLGIRVYPDRDALCHDWGQMRDRAAYVAQPFVTGTAASLSLLAKDGEAVLLSVNRQRIALMDDELVLLGCVVNGVEADDDRFQRLAGAVAAALPGLWGYVGLDLILHPDGPQVLEVNPRLTTSYVGLRESLGLNPAGLVLDLCNGGRPSPLPPTAGRVVDVCLEDCDEA